MKTINFFKFALIVMLICFTSAVSAANWYLSPIGSDTNDGSSGTPFKTLSKALSAASTNDVIHVTGFIDMTLEPSKAGVRGDIALAGTSTYTTGGVTYNTWNVNSTLGIITLNKTLTIVGDDKTTCGFDGKNATCIIRQDGSSNTIMYQNLTFKNGKSADGSGGGGMYIRSTTASFTNCEFSGNASGGTSNVNPGGAVTIISATATFNTTRFASNIAKFGCGIYAQSGTITLDGCTIENNDASGVSSSVGAGIYVKPSAALTIDIKNSLLKNNKTTAEGGAIYYTDASVFASTLKFTNCAFISNQASLGGAAFIDNKTASATLNLSFINSTFYDNLVGGTSGGALLINSALTGSNINLINCTITGNKVTGTTGSAGAGIRMVNTTVNSTRRIYNCIIENNYGTSQDWATLGNYADLVIQGEDATNVTIDKSFIAKTSFNTSTNGAKFVSGNNFNYAAVTSGSVNNSFRAKFGTFNTTYNCYPLLSTSPAINYGTSTYLSTLSPTVSTDQIGNIRQFSGSVCDAGAIEVPRVTITSSSSSTFYPSVIPLTITFSNAVTGFDISDITVSNGSKGTLSGNGTTYTVDITPSAPGNVTVDIAADAANDVATNGNKAATQFVRTVNKNIYLSSTGSDANDGLTSGTAVASFSHAQSLASSGETIYVSGMIDFSADPANTSSPKVGITLTKTLTIQGTSSTTDGFDGNNATRFIQASNASYTLTLKNLKLYRGKSATAGGAIYINGSTVSGENLIFDSNTTYGTDITGAALYVGTTAGLSFKSCTFSNNSATKSGAIYINDAAASVLMKFEDCAFISNTAQATTGGAALFLRSTQASPTLSLINCTVAKNNVASAIDGAAIYLYSGLSTATVNIINCTITENTTAGSSGHGAGIRIYTTAGGQFLGKLNIQNSIIEGNYSTQTGTPYSDLSISSVAPTSSTLMINNSIIGKNGNVTVPTECYPGTNQFNYITTTADLKNLAPFNSTNNYYPLYISSSAIGYGASSYLSSLSPTVTTDQLWNTRPFTGGICDAGAVETTKVASTTPGAPTITGVTAGNGQLSVAFTSGTSGGSAVTNYKYTTDGSTWITRSPIATTSPIVIGSLTNGTSYNVQIKAVNANGDGAASGSTAATPKASPTISVSGTQSFTYNGSAQGPSTITYIGDGTTSQLYTNVGGTAYSAATAPSNAGNYQVVASATSTASNNAATSAAYTFTINKATPALTVSNTPVSYDGTPKSATASALGGGDVTNILTGGAATQTTAGTYTVTADIAASTNYNAAIGVTATNSFVIDKASQSITFNVLPTGKKVGDADFAPGATSATSGTNAITYSSSNTAVASIVSGNIRLVGAGDCFIYADQDASTNYNAATQASRSLTVDAAAVSTINIASGTTQDASIVFTSPTADVTVSGINTVVNVDVTKIVNSLTISSAGKVTVPNSLSVTDGVTVAPNATLDLSNTLSIGGDLTLKADQTSTFIVKVGSPMTITGNVKFLKTMDDTKWYFMAFPCDVALSGIKVNGSSVVVGTNLFIKYYSGSKRASNGPNPLLNWIQITDDHLSANQGYIFGLPDGAGNNVFVITFPLDKNVLKSEADHTGVPVNYYGALTSVENNRGWNLIGQPFLSKYASQNGNILNLYRFDGTTYLSYANNTNDMPEVNPFEAYFTQVSSGLETSGLSFALTSRRLTPASVAVNQSDLVRLNISTTTGTDKTYLIMDDLQSTSYQIGEDLEKMITTETTVPQVYSVLGGINYANNALPVYNVQNLPIGFYTQTAGITTISVDATKATSLSKLLLTDNGVTPATVTDLLLSDYTFIAAAGTNNSRFAITAQRIPTVSGIQTDIDTNAPTFVINNSKLIINNLNGKANVRVFDAIGRMVANKTMSNNSLEINLSAKGMYTVQIEAGGKNWVKKIVF